MKNRITGCIIILLSLTMIFAQDWEVVKKQSFDLIPDDGFFLDVNTGWLVMDDFHVWKTTDAAANWSLVSDTSGMAGIDPVDVEFIDANIGYMCANDGLVWKTTDGGSNWTEISDTPNYTLDVCHISVISADLVFFSCDDGQVLKWDGTTMTADTLMMNDSTYATEDIDGGINFIDANVGVAIADGNGGYTWYTHDGGATWTFVEVASLFPIGAASTRIYDVNGYGNGMFVIGGYHYTIFVSSDSGQTYTAVGDINYGYVRYEYVDIIDANTFIAVAAGHTVKTTDGGTTLDTLAVGSGQSIKFAQLLDADNGYIFCSYGQWFKTTNGGASFSPLLDWPQISLWGLAFPEEGKIVSTSWGGGEITFSVDGGLTWTYPENLTTGSPGNLYEVEFIDVNTGFIGGGSGTLKKTTDGGATFTQIENPMILVANKHINSLRYYDANTIYAGGSSGYVMQSTDGGATWSDTKINSSTVYDIWALDANTILASESSGKFCYGVFDGGAVVTDSLAIDVGGNAMRAVEVRGDVVIVPASTGEIFRTTLDDLPGLVSVFTDPDGDDLYDVEFVDDTTAYVVGENGKIYMSTDAGLTWTAMTSPTTTTLAKVRLSGYELWAVGKEGTILKLDLFPPYELPISEEFTGGDFDLEWELNVTGGAGNLAIADSTGSAWDSHVGAFTDDGYTGIAHVKNAVFGDFTISADVHIIGPADINAPLYAGIAFRASHDDLAYYRFIYRNSSSSSHGQLKLQGYDGAAWHISAAWDPGVDFTALETGWHNFKITVEGNNFYAYIDDQLLPGCPYSDDTPFMTEGYPGIFKYNAGASTILFDNFLVTDPVPVVSVDDDPTLPVSFALHQNYPNPFNPVTTIRFDLPMADHIRIDIYNILGKKVRTLVNDYVPAGRQQVLWDSKDDFGRQAASGMYLYRISGERYHATKRMVLLK